MLEAGCGWKTRLAGHRDRISELVGVDLDAAAGAENPALDQFTVADLPTRYRANTPGRLAGLLAGAGFAPVEVHYVATVHRYAERRPALAALLRAVERCLPSRLRSTIVAWYRPV